MYSRFFAGAHQATVSHPWRALCRRLSCGIAATQKHTAGSSLQPWWQQEAEEEAPLFLLVSSPWRRGGLLRSRSGQMKRSGGGPAAQRGDVSTEGKQLFVCLSVTLCLSFISLQGSGVVFTHGAVLSFSLSLSSSPPASPSFSPCLHPHPQTAFLLRECQKVFRTRKSLCT